MVLIDANGLFFRTCAFITYKKEEPVNVDVLFNALIKTYESIQQTICYTGKYVYCFDSGHNWRKRLYPLYKIGRKKSTNIHAENMYKAFNLMENYISQFDIVLRVDETEADDLIFTLVKIFKDEEHIIVSSDKDFFQLQNEKVKQYSLSQRDFITGKFDEFTHVCIGDKVDGVENILSNDFNEKNLDYFNRKVKDFYSSKHYLEKLKLLVNNKWEQEDLQIIFDNGGFFKHVALGEKTLSKKIDKEGIEWIYNNDIIFNKFKLNYNLISKDGIPKYIEEKIIKSFNEEAKKERTVFNLKSLNSDFLF